MSLIKRGRYWWIDVRINKKRYRRSLRTPHKTLALARYGIALEQLQAQFGGERIRMVDFAKKYIEWAWSSKPKSALREHQRLHKIVQFLMEACQVVYLDDITPYHVETLKVELKKRGLAKATINRYLQILRGLFYKAIDWELYEKPNPLKKVRFYREEGTREALSEAEVAKILDASKTISSNAKSKLQKCFYDLVVLALNTGMRRSEVLNLTRKSVRGDTLRIKGKGDKVRIVPLNSQARQVVEMNRYRMSDDDYIFDIPNRNQPALMRNTTKRISRMTNIKFTFHQLRHTFATRLLEKGVDIVTVGTILGHSTRMISLLYSHTNKNQMRKAVELLNS